MPHYDAMPTISISEGVNVITTNIIPICPFSIINSIPPGNKRIAADNPSKVVLGNAPVSRVIDLFDKETNVHVARTISSPIDGTYSFEGLPDREYFVICRGINGENDSIHTRIRPV
jgi:hypothetical protein